MTDISATLRPHLSGLPGLEVGNRRRDDNRNQWPDHVDCSRSDDEVSCSSGLLDHQSGPTIKELG